MFAAEAAPTGFVRAIPGRGRWLVVAVVLLAGCAQLPSSPIASGDSPVAACRGLFEAMDAEVRRAGVTDAGARRVEDFPWLRVDRPLASFRNEVETEDRFRDWLGHLSRLDAEGRGFERAHLPETATARLTRHWQPASEAHGLSGAIEPALAGCRTRLDADLLRDASARERLKTAATAPDAYVDWMRAIGFYPLVRPLVRGQVVALHERLDDLMEAGPEPDRLRHYVAVDAGVTGTEARVRVPHLRRDALGIPVPTPRQRAALFAAHAPVWSIETRTRADRPGALRLEDEGEPVVDSGEAVEYRHLGWTRFDGSVLLQLEYTLWFPARAARGTFDPYAGELDAVTWRVTLTDGGEVLAYDSIHACGCYYTLFPGPGREARTDFPASEEPVFAPLPAPRTGPGETVRIRLEADRHYLLGVAPVARAGADIDERLVSLPADRLRSLPLPDGGRAGVFEPDGLIPESARPERLFLWPLGVPSAGAMRQRGHHAIAFIGRRHFDDPFLLESLLETE